MSRRGGAPRPGRLCPQGLSAAFGDLYRAGDPRARTARARHPDRLAAPPDRPQDAIRCIAAIRAERLYLPEYLYQEPLRVWRGWRIGAAAAGLSRRAGAPGSPIWGATRRPNRVRRFGQALVLAAELPRGHRPPARAFPPYAGLGRALCGADLRASPGASRRMPRTSGRPPTGKSAKSSPRPSGR